MDRRVKAVTKLLAPDLTPLLGTATLATATEARSTAAALA
jgi:hypothetical protein